MKRKFSKERIKKLRAEVSALKSLAPTQTDLQTRGGRRRLLLSKYLREFMKEKGIKPDNQIGVSLRNLSNSDPQARILGIDNLNFPNKSHLVAEPLIAVLKDENARVRKAAVEVLGKLWVKRAFQPLARRLRDANFEVRAEAVSSLAGMASGLEMEEKSFPLLKKGFLEELRGERATKVLSNYMHAFRFFIRSELHGAEATRLALKVFELKGYIKHKFEAIPIFIRYLKGKALKKALNVALKDKSAAVGEEAVEAIGLKYQEFLKGDDLKRAQVAAQFFRGENRQILLGMLVLRPDVRRQCPLSIENVKGRKYLVELMNGIEDREARELKKIIKWEQGLK